MFDESTVQFILKVSVEDPSKPVDLDTFLSSIPHVHVTQTFAQIPPTTESILVFVEPQGEFNASALFTVIEDRTQKWCESRPDTVTVEIHKPDGHFQVVVKSAA
jgi:hypothetical protein